MGRFQAGRSTLVTKSASGENIMCCRTGVLSCNMAAPPLHWTPLPGLPAEHIGRNAWTNTQMMYQQRRGMSTAHSVHAGAADEFQFGKSVARPSLDQNAYNKNHTPRGRHLSMHHS